MKNADEVAPLETAPPEVASSSPADRRRPGRSEALPELIPLLRGDHGQAPERDDLQPILGVAFSLLVSAVCYAMVWAVATYLVLRHARLH